MSASRHDHWGDHPDTVLAGVQPKNLRAPAQEPVFGYPPPGGGYVFTLASTMTRRRSGRRVQRLLVGGRWSAAGVPMENTTSWLLSRCVAPQCLSARWYRSCHVLFPRPVVSYLYVMWISWWLYFGKLVSLTKLGKCLGASAQVGSLITCDGLDTSSSPSSLKAVLIYVSTGQTRWHHRSASRFFLEGVIVARSDNVVAGLS